MMEHFGWRAVLAVIVSTVIYSLLFRRELRTLASRRPVPDVDQPEEPVGGERCPALPVPAWLTVVHLLFMAWTVLNAHYPVLFVGGFLFFLGFLQATAPYQSRVDLKAPLLVGFFLGGPGRSRGTPSVVDRSGAREPLRNATVLRRHRPYRVQRQRAITFLSTLVPNLGDSLKIAVVEGR